MNGQRTPTHHSRTLDFEPDCIVIIPAAPDYAIIGTYHLLSDNVRSGSLQIIPYHHPESEQYLRRPENTNNHYLDHIKLPTSGIYDIRFHPIYTDILAVATSDSRILFYTVHIDRNALNPEICGIHLQKVGDFTLKSADGDVGIITMVQLLSSADHNIDPNGEAMMKRQGGLNVPITLLATTQSGETFLVRFRILEKEGGEMTVVQVHRTEFELEAWTCMYLRSSEDTGYVFSGGDDSHLVVSEVDLKTFESKQILRDKRTHGAGVVSIVELPVVSHVDTNDSHCPLVLTGSYDEYLRLFKFLPPNTTAGVSRARLELISELKMPGGVWRILVLDSYQYLSGNSTEYVLLTANHTGGAHIVRLILSRNDNSDDWQAKIEIEASFTDGHESLVYAVAAQRSEEGNGEVDLRRGRKWDVVSTSFYDKKVCNWSWTDEKRIDSPDI